MIRAQGDHGRRSRPGRGLSLDRIVTATLELMDEQGIGAATMRAVSSRLEVRSMSLYRYVQDRDELFDAVVERIVNELADDPEVRLRPVDGWRPYLAAMAHGVRRYARAHPHAFPLVATRPPAAPWVNPPLRSLRWVSNTMSSQVHAEPFYVLKHGSMGFLKLIRFGMVEIKKIKYDGSLIYTL